MKKILITGKNSYIGNSLKKWLEKWPALYTVSVVDMLNNDWNQCDFSEYDCVYHVAGIAHKKNVSDEMYDKVNHILAVDVARKAIESGVSQFILMSSGAVYSQNDKKHKEIKVDESSELNPSTSYGISKMKAEKDILVLSKLSKTKIAILRPPMVYGYGAKGNYNSLVKIATKLSFFPKIENTRSMIYIDNLCEFIRLVIDNECDGVYLPQNGEYVCTYKMVKLISEIHGKQMFLTKIMNLGIHILGILSDKVNKAFGSYIYLKRNGKDYFDGSYQIVDFETSIKRSEGITNE